MVLCFTSDDESLLVGDKTGEVHLYTLDSWDAAGGHQLGHFSILLDMVRSSQYAYKPNKNKMFRPSGAVS